LSANLVRHAICGHPVTIAVLDHDDAIYVCCIHCCDIVEAGELVLMDLPTYPTPSRDRDDINVRHFFLVESDGQGRPQ
jgi:hypothetical protein